MNSKILRILLPLVSICILAVLDLPTKSANSTLVKIATLWNAPDTVVNLSPDGDYVVIQDDEEIQYLVKVPSGEVIQEIYGSFHFSPSGRYLEAHPYKRDNENYQPETTLLDLTSGNKHTLRFAGSILDYSPDERYVLLVTDHERIKTRVLDLQTDEVVFESANYGSIFNPTDNWIVVGDYSDPNQITIQVIEFQSNTLLASFTINNEGAGVSGVYPAFSPNNRLLVLRNLRTGITPVVSTETWTVLYETQGTVIFSYDNQYIAANNWEGQSNVQLLDAMTGQVLDEVFGGMGFSRDGRYLFRSEAISYDERHFILIDMMNQSAIFERTGYIDISRVAGTDWIKVYDWVESQTEFVEMTTGESIRKVDGDANYNTRWLVIGDIDTGLYHLLDWESSEVLFTSHEPIRISSNGRYVFITNDVSIAAYSNN